VGISFPASNRHRCEGGNTITHVERPCQNAIGGFVEVKPMVFAGLYPVDADDYED